jgi:thiamine kinase-like enzyme
VASTEQLSPAEIVSRISDWNGAEVKLEPLGGGITNHNYVVGVTVPGRPEKRYVLRVPGEGTDLFIDRGNERACSVAAAQAGVAPEVCYVVGDAMVIAFIEAETMHPDTLAGRQDRVEQAVRALKQVHERAVFPMQIELFDMIRRYTDMAREVGAPFPAEMDRMFAVGEEVEAALRRDPPAPAACHNDLLSENFLIDRGGRMWIIDWEYGGMADPYFDLGDFCVEQPLTEDEEKLVLTAYCGGMDEHRYSRMMLHKLVADLWWSIWAMIQATLSKLDFDFYDYGMNRIRRMQNNAAHPDYEAWLAAV